jgi:hypothetical protein
MNTPRSRKQTQHIAINHKAQPYSSKNKNASARLCLVARMQGVRHAKLSDKQLH